jgi:hypothetical protein
MAGTGLETAAGDLERGSRLLRDCRVRQNTFQQVSSAYPFSFSISIANQRLPPVQGQAALPRGSACQRQLRCARAGGARGGGGHARLGRRVGPGALAAQRPPPRPG